jgi:hypothetical protein
VAGVGPGPTASASLPRSRGGVIRAQILKDLARSSGGSKLRRALAVAVTASATVACLLAAAPAQAKNLYTLDANADSGGQIVVDAAGNGYIAWLRHGSPDLVMFCKIPANGRCANAINLPLPAANLSNGQPDQPFAVLGATNQVWVVAPRAALGDIVYWLSTNGGQSFGAPVDVTVAGDFAGGKTVADILLDPAEPSITATPPVAYFDIASTDPGLGYSRLPSNLASGGEATSFSFALPATPPVGNASLGEQADGHPLEAYSTMGSGQLGSPDTVYYFRQTVAGGSVATLSDAWTNSATLVGPGYLPALAGGPKGLFLAYYGYVTEGLIGRPSVLRVLSYDQATGLFGAPTSLAVDRQNNTSLNAGGTINENATTGELAVAWPKFGAGGTVMRLWTSKDGGAKFSGASSVAKVGGGYSGTAALAVNAKGGGFIAFQTSGGLQIANLAPIPKPKKR